MKAYKDKETGNYFTNGNTNTSVCFSNSSVCVQFNEKTKNTVAFFRLKK